MMTKLFFFLLVSTSLHALLPPAWEGVREIKAILDDENLSHYLNSGDLILSIERQEEGWVIKTNHSSIKVKVQKLPQSMPGPEKFELHYDLNKVS